MKDYVRALRQSPWLFEAVELAFGPLPDSAVTDGQSLLKGLRASDGRPLTDSDVLVVLNALCDLGVAERRGSRYNLHKQRWRETEQLRQGIQSAVAILEGESTQAQTEAHLCVSLPPAIQPAVEHVIRESSADLRSGLLDVIAGAQDSLLVASPFWDAGTTGEIANLAVKKLNAGVSVTLLGRFSQEMPAAVRTELQELSKHPNCAVLSWFEGTGVDTQTFHFKAITADSGARAYLGSANMTVSSLRSRMELGVVLSGSVAQDLDRVLRVVLTMASPVFPAK